MPLFLFLTILLASVFPLATQAALWEDLVLPLEPLNFLNLEQIKLPEIKTVKSSPPSTSSLLNVSLPSANVILNGVKNLLPELKLPAFTLPESSAWTESGELMRTAASLLKQLKPKK